MSIPFALRRFAAVAALAVVAAPAARAQLVSDQPPVCSAGNALGITGALACSGAWRNNNMNQEASVLAQILADWGTTYGLTGVAFAGTTNEGQSTGPFKLFGNTTTGTLEFKTAQTGYFVVALKGSNDFSLYLFNGGTQGISSFDFTTAGVETNNPGLSHATLYTTTTPVNPNVVPEPSTYALMATGLAGLTALARRRRRA